MSSTDNFYIKQEEPNKSCFLALREIIIAAHSEINETIKYGMPCFCFKNKSMCYLWKDKKSNEPYILFVEGKLIEHPKLEQGDRKRMKVYPVDPNSDIKIEEVNSLLTIALDLYLRGVIKVK
jgi:Domain of unknown function (DU1801)